MMMMMIYMLIKGHSFSSWNNSTMTMRASLSPSFLPPPCAHLSRCQITIHSRFCWSMPTLRCTVHSWNCIALYPNCIVLRHCAIVALDILKTAQGFKMLFSFACVQCGTDSAVVYQRSDSTVKFWCQSKTAGMVYQCTAVQWRPEGMKIER